MRRILAHSLALLLATVAIAEADVAVAVKNGQLVVKSNDAESILTLDGTGLPLGSVRATPGGGFTVNGSMAPQVFTGLTDAGAKITLGKGSDVLNIENLVLQGPVAIKTGDGGDVLSIQASTLTSTTKIDVGGGLNLLRVCRADVLGDLTVKLGKGAPGVGFAECEGQFGITATDGSGVLFWNVLFAATVTVKGAAAPHVVSMHTFEGLTGVTLKNVRFARLCYGDVIAGPVVLKLANLDGPAGVIECDGGTPTGFAEGSTAALITDVDLAGVTAKLGKGGDMLAIFGAMVSGDVTVNFGGGTPNALVFQSVTITGDLVGKAGKGNDDVIANDFLVNGDATLKLGDGGNAVAFTVTRFDRDLTIKTGKGDDFADLGGAEVDGESKIDLGKGANMLTPPLP